MSTSSELVPRRSPPPTQPDSTTLRDAKASTCGNCLYAQIIPADLTQVLCAGMPPTPVIVGMTAQGPAVATMRPQVPRAMPACSVWKAEKPLIIGAA